MEGKVWLVGAGPGDPELLTKKAERLIGSCDVIVYDHLIGDSLLAVLPPSATLIDVGKIAGYHKVTQGNINKLLVEEAKKGQQVLRLKGGDPFLFGRGGEELEALVAEGIPYEVVPGITSAISVPAYFGIPVTHRDYASSVHIITGHSRKGGAEGINYEALVAMQGTFIFLMGVASLERIGAGLLGAGMKSEMPAALLIKGTTAQQQMVLGTVGNLAELVQPIREKTPAIIVVGDVCNLSKELKWRDLLPLSDKKIVLTRPLQSISRTGELLRELGAEVLEMPSIETKSLLPQPLLTDVLETLADFKWLVFTSAIGVDTFFDYLREIHWDIRGLQGRKIAVIGPGTKRRLEERGLLADLMPSVYDGRHLGESLRKVIDVGEKVALLRAKVGNQEIVEALEDIEVVDVPLYETHYRRATLDLKDKSKGIDYVVFTSASTVEGFVQGSGIEDFSEVVAICIGQMTEAAAKERGMQTVVAEEASIDSLIEKIVEMGELQ